MQRTHLVLALFALAIGFLVIGGCQSTRSARYYVLVSVAPAQAPAGDPAKGPVVIVDPVVLPGYLERPQLVSGGSPGELRLAHDERWSEDLSENATRVLADDLSARLPSERVGVLRPGSRSRGGTRLRVEISRFEREADGSVGLVARWSLRRQGQPEPYLMRRSTIRVEPAGSGTADTVRAMSRALASLADEVSQALQPRHARRAKPERAEPGA